MAAQQILIIGAGQAGGQLALQLRQHGFTGNITLAGTETTAPYERPALSKGILTGKLQTDSLLIRPEASYAEQQIDLQLATRVTDIDLEKRQARLNNSVMKFDILVFATGATPRALSLPGSDLRGVHLLRTDKDALTIKNQLSNANSVAIIGGGFIGMEVAASITSLGISTQVLERGPRIMARSLPAFLAEKIASLHDTISGSNPVRYNASIRSFRGTDTITAVEFTDGSLLEADAVIAGIGVIANSQMAEVAGIECDNGILTDATGCTSVPGVYAIGDCANRYMPRYGRQQRLESYQSANLQAENLAKHLMQQTEIFDPVPWLWSDQHQWQIQTLGFPAEAEHWLQRGDLTADRKEIHLGYTDNGGNRTLSSVVSIAEGTAAAGDVKILQRLMEAGITPAAEQLTDTRVKLKALLKAVR